MIAWFIHCSNGLQIATAPNAFACRLCVMRSLIWAVHDEGASTSRQARRKRLLYTRIARILAPPPGATWIMTYGAKVPVTGDICKQQKRRPIGYSKYPVKGRVINAGEARVLRRTDEPASER